MPYVDPLGHFKHRIDMSLHDGLTENDTYTIMAAYEWAMEHFGSPRTNGVWSYSGKIFGFQNSDQALLFKLTWC